MREDFLDHRLFQDRRNHLQLTATIRAVLQIQIDHPSEQLCPAQLHRAVVRAVRFSRGEHRFLDRRFGLLQYLLRHHQSAQLGVVRLAPMSTLLESNCIGESKSNDALGTAIMNLASSMGGVKQDHGFRSNPLPSSPHPVR